ncbi:mucin-4-like [Battus philenor]|uniref:mucin-4-like n=1 Tax=Battus philenor TaxID=42288 RepID=UPI0035D103A4
MTRRKSACTKWTLVLVLTLMCQTVFSRPQDDALPGVLGSSTQSATETPTENPISNEKSDSSDDKINDNEYGSREDTSSEISELSKINHPKVTKKVYYKPRPHSEHYPTNPPNIQYIDNIYTPTRPTYVFTTPTPTPIITNVGYPPPWPQQNYHVIQPVTTTQRPIRVTKPANDHYNYHNNVNNYPQYPVNNFEVTTFQPTSAYTDRIIIRPEEYSASPDDCPTIYLSLNNTFQGQGKEACPDLNIAVNTNVINKNVVIESEEDTDNSFVGAFGVPLMDDSESGDNNNDYSESADDEEENESASIEGAAMTNYNANTAQESAEPGNFASPSSALSTVSTPGRPRENRNFRKESIAQHEISPSESESSSTSREVKERPPIIGDSVKKVAVQLLHKTSNDTIENPVVIDTRIPPKLKNQIKHRIKTRNDDGDEPSENSHIGIAVPITMEELESENAVTDSVSESSTPNEGISTWILLNNPANKENPSSSTEPTKIEEQPKKQKPTNAKNKTKGSQHNKIPKRPIISSTNKSDLIAGGSAINENVYNKIKDTVLSNVQKNKNGQRTISTTTTPVTTEASTTKKESTTKASTTAVSVNKTTKLAKKKNKNKTKVSTSAPVVSESASLPMEAKEQEIEIEVSTPVTTTKKPKRSSTRKKNKTKKRKTTKPKAENTTAVTSELKNANKTKSSKLPKPSNTGPITTQIYNYFSREVMPSVGVGVIGLAGLVGIASYFLYPFATPVRRTFEVDKKDDIYKNNAEEYGSEGNGQAEEEMLGTVLAGMPAHAKHKINPYAAQTPNLNRYQVKKDQDIRYRQVQHTHAASYDPHYKAQHYAQQKTGLAHGAVYPEQLGYNRQQYETRHAYTPETRYDKVSTSYPQYPAVEPIYTAPQTGPAGTSSFGSDTSNSVVYGVKPSPESDFKPVYPFDGQFYQQETTSHPATYSPTSMFLGSNSEADEGEDKYSDNSNSNFNSGTVDNKFVVGNVPKELSDESATPAVVPEHGPRNIRKRRSLRKKRGITQSIEDILKSTKDNTDIFLSNEIDEIPHIPSKYTSLYEVMKDKDLPKSPENVLAVYPTSVDPKVSSPTGVPSTTLKSEVVESISTLPLDHEEETSTESENSDEIEVTTKSFKVFTNNPITDSDKSSPLFNNGVPKSDTTTQNKNLNTETTTELKSETTSTMPPSPQPVTEPKLPSPTSPYPTYGPEVITYPPLNQDGGFFGFLKRIVEFKYKLGLSILQTTTDSLNRYLRNMENSVKTVSNQHQ